jgi:hypothetical protein
MTTSELIVTIAGLITVALAPVVVAVTNGLRRGRPLVSASIAAAVIAILWAVYWLVLANPHHSKHAILFGCLAIVALVAASFSRPLALEAA